MFANVLVYDFLNSALAALPENVDIPFIFGLVAIAFVVVGFVVSFILGSRTSWQAGFKAADAVVQAVNNNKPLLDAIEIIGKSVNQENMQAIIDGMASAAQLSNNNDIKQLNDNLAKLLKMVTDGQPNVIEPVDEPKA